FGSVLFRAIEEVDLPPPGDTRAARLHVRLRDVPWDVLYAPIAGLVGFVAERLNKLQFLTIRGYLTLIFGAFVQLCQMMVVLAAAPLLAGYVRKVKALLVGRRGPPMVQPYRDLLRLLRKEVVLAHSASWVFRATPYLVFAATWVGAALVPTFATGLLFSYAADMIAIVALLGSARFMLALAGLDVGTS